MRERAFIKLKLLCIVKIFILAMNYLNFFFFASIRNLNVKSSLSPLSCLALFVKWCENYLQITINF